MLHINRDIKLSDWTGHKEQPGGVVVLAHTELSTEAILSTATICMAGSY